ncbi:TPA: hypothetical protein R1699_001590, partial [Campylobacter lari]|nr:hypothetical protein [Campylobacter lari]
MIKKIKIIHYKSFDNYDMSGFEFKRINLIYGLNGMGKSSLINFIKDSIENKKLDAFETSYNDFNIFFYDVKYKDSLFYSNDKFKTFYIADDIENLILEKNKLIDKKGNLEKLSSRIENKLNEINKK